ncbi:UDP-glucosyltransferase 2-like [Galleria mellonella]|uniref:UDP-glucosyltransferase 2-like n=1 Tax=Galleria mellonella TaxID=7137 RepID=A0ABM3MH76_GALME|nr:UDP-glucosyltransferase 2-like [Galleria mellonella]
MEVNTCFTRVLLTIVLFNKVYTLNILGVFPFEGKSHSFVFNPFMLELAKRGHNVTVISHFPQKKPVQNYRDISLAGKSKILVDVFSLYRSYWSIIEISLFLVNSGTANCKLVMADENVQNLWKTQTKFDLVVTEQFNSDCYLGLAHKLKAPVIGITSHKIMPWHMSRFGIVYNPSHTAFTFLEGGTKPTLYQRIERVIFHNYFNILYKYFCQRIDEETLAQYFDDVPPLEELGRDIKLLLVYQNFAMMGSHIFPSNVIEIGGLHVVKPKPLPKDLKKFIEESEHGIVYISFGSMLKAVTMPTDKLQAIIDALSLLPQRVVWKWEDQTLPGNPKNIYISKWIPQNDVLAHPNVMAFYSHCGLLSTTEAINYGVPMVAMPIFGDQPVNAAAVEESGLGYQIQINELSKEKLLAKFKAVLDPTFRENVKRLSKVWHDRPISAMDTAIFWTEFVARNKNITLSAAAANVPYYQYWCLDILSVFVIFILTITFLIKYLLSFFKRNKRHAMNRKSKKE